MLPLRKYCMMETWVHQVGLQSIIFLNISCPKITIVKLLTKSKTNTCLCYILVLLRCDYSSSKQWMSVRTSAAAHRAALGLPDTLQLLAGVRFMDHSIACYM